MAAHRQAFPTPRGDGKGDPKGGTCRLLDIVAHRLWWIGTTARRAPRRKPAGAVTMGVYPCRSALGLLPLKRHRIERFAGGDGARPHHAAHQGVAHFL